VEQQPQPVVVNYADVGVTVTTATECCSTPAGWRGPARSGRRGSAQLVPTKP